MRKNFFLLFAILLVTACGGDDDIEDDKPVIGKSYINVTPNMQLLADGQTAELKIESNCEWTITKTENWLTVTPMSGANTQNVTITAGKNTTLKERNAVLSITAKEVPKRSVVVTQLASGSDTQQQGEPAPDDNLPPS